MIGSPPPPPPQKPPAPPTGDATSQLVQVIARDVGHKFAASGNGANDIRSLICEVSNTKTAVDTLWQMAQDFMKAIDESPDPIPERFKAIVAASVLRARSNRDLGRKQ